MELNEDNFKLMAQYLQQTLSPDPNVRRPGKKVRLYTFKHLLQQFPKCL